MLYQLIRARLIPGLIFRESIASGNNEGWPWGTLDKCQAFGLRISIKDIEPSKSSI